MSIDVGTVWSSGARTVTAEDIRRFAELSGDFNRLHTDADWVREHTGFDDVIAHGLLVLAISNNLPMPGLDERDILGYLNVERRMSLPVYAGDTLRQTAEVAAARPSGSREGAHVVTVRVSVLNQRDEEVQSGVDTYLIGEGRAS